jgi:hypothetical protein
MTPFISNIKHHTLPVKARKKETGKILHFNKNKILLSIQMDSKF